MENQFSYHHYSLAEFYTRVLKHIKPQNLLSYRERVWSLMEKISFLQYLRRGFPCPPIVIDGNICIDGMNRIDVILDLMMGGLDSYFTLKERDHISHVGIGVYIADRPLQDDDRLTVRRSFSGPLTKAEKLWVDPEPTAGAGGVGGGGTTGTTGTTGGTTTVNDPAFEEFETIKIISPPPSSIKKITATVKTKIPKKQIHESLKTSVWNKYIGADKGTAPCWCCSFTTITQREFDTGHVIAEINGGTTNLDNLRPICRKCNLSMGAQNMEDFKARCYGTTEESASKSAAFRLLL